MSSFITGDKCILRARRVSLGGAALAIFALALPPTAAGEAASASKGHAAASTVHHRSVHAPHARTVGHTHAATSSSKGRHVQTHATANAARTTAAGLAHYSPGGTAGVQSTATASTPYADADAAERHHQERIHEWHKWHHHGWHGYAWWHRHHWWTTAVQSLVGSTIDTPAQPESTTGETTAAAGGGALPAGPVKIVNRKTGAALWRGAIFRIEHAGDRVKIVASKSGHYLALREPVNHGDGAVPAPGAARVHLAEAKDPQSATTFWKAESAGDGFWTLVNCETEKVMEDRGSEGVVVQSASREGALEQQWRVESATE